MEIPRRFNEKGQVASYDIIAAMAVFLLLIVVISSLWNSNLDGIEKRLIRNDMKLAAYAVTDLLVETSGIPSNWESIGNADVVGLAKGKRIIGSEKTTALAVIDYNSVKSGLKLEGYDFYIRIVVDGNTEFSYGVQNTDANYAIGLSRVVEFDNDLGNFYLTLYRD